MSVEIIGVEAGSPAARARIKSGDTLVSINGREIGDVLDYRFFVPDTRLRMELVTVKGRRRVVRLKKEPYEEIGLEFSTYLMDKQRSCRNNCIFCFIDQLPDGMRDSLYFKDDDDRLSFLFGNYITLTNLTEREVERIIELHISPVNISVHTTNPELRCKMMNNRFAGQCLSYLHRFAEAGLDINCQLVLVPGYNDGEELQRSMEDLAALYPAVRSVAAVPVGLTKHREGLPELRLFTPEECRQVVAQMTAMGDRMLEQHGCRVFYPSDEWYLRGDLPFSEGYFYDDYPQLENGVGMVTMFVERFLDELEDWETPPVESRVVVATGMAAAPVLQELVEEAKERFPTLQAQVCPIRNDFFGETITVSGLVTGGDLIAQLKDVPMERLILPINMLRQELDLFLDDVSVEQVEEALGVPIIFVNETDGADFLEALMISTQRRRGKWLNQ